VRFHYQRSPVGAPVIDIPAPTVADFWALAGGFVQHILPSPLPVFCIVRESEEIFDGIYSAVDNAGNPIQLNPDTNTPATQGTTGSIVNILARLRAAEGLSSDVLYCGFYPNALEPSLPSGGYGGNWTFTIPNVIPGLMAHELGHALGLAHAPTPAFKPGYAGTDLNFPRYGSLEWGTIGEVGFDTIQPLAVEPGNIPPGPVPARKAFDIMGYDVPRWISPYNYQKLFSAVGAPKAGPCSSRLPPPLVLDRSPRDQYFTCYYVEGLPGGDFIRKLCGPKIPFLPPWPPLDPPGPIRVTLLDARGAAIFEDTAAISTLSEPHDAPRLREFWITVPVLNDAVRLILTHGDQVIEDSELVPRPVRLDAKAWLLDGPRGTVRVEWSLRGRHARVPVFVRASSDDGRSWTAFNVPSDAKQIDIDPASLPPGKGCIVEVLAGSRLNTSSWRSENMPVQTGCEAVIILAPREDSRMQYGEAIELIATPTYGVGHDDLTWSSDRDGDLGVGGYQLVRLSPGRHVLSVRRGEWGKPMKAAVVQVVNRLTRSTKNTRNQDSRSTA
jgi:hypothetical protein